MQIKLTPLEARAVLTAVENFTISASFEEVVDLMAGSKREASALYRADVVLRQALNLRPLSNALPKGGAQ